MWGRLWPIGGETADEAAARSVIERQPGLNEPVALDTVRDLCTRDIDDAARAAFTMSEQLDTDWFVPAMEAACPDQLVRLRR